MGFELFFFFLNVVVGLENLFESFVVVSGFSFSFLFFFGFFFVRSLGTWCPVPTCPDRDRVLFCFSSKGTCAAAAAAGAARICASLDFILFFSIYPTGSRYVIKKNNNK